MPTLKEKGEELLGLATKNKKILDDIRDPASGEIKSMSAAQQTEFIQTNDAMAKVQGEYDAMKMVDDAYLASVKSIKGIEEMERGFAFGSGGGNGQFPTEAKTLGRMFTESTGYKALQASSDPNPFGVESIKMHGIQTEAKGASIKTLFDTSAGFAPFVPRQANIVFSPQMPTVVADLIPQADTTYAAIRYMEETTFTNNAAAVAEGGTKPEAALQYTERIIPMSKIAVTLPVTEEQLADVPQIESVLDNRLGLMLRLEEQRELLNGSGTSPEMSGYLNKAGIISTTKGALDSFSAILYAITQVNGIQGFANVDGIVLNPTDEFNIRTIKDNYGRFIMGEPSAVGPTTLWGKKMVASPSIATGTILVGDFHTYSQIFRRTGITFRVGYVNSQFIQNSMTILVEERLVLVIYRALAYATVTGTFTS